jgi:hypothetical protein
VSGAFTVSWIEVKGPQSLTLLRSICYRSIVFTSMLYSNTVIVRIRSYTGFPKDC